MEPDVLELIEVVGVGVAVRSSRVGGRQRPLVFNWPKLNFFCDFFKKVLSA